MKKSTFTLMTIGCYRVQLPGRIWLQRELTQHTAQKEIAGMVGFWLPCGHLPHKEDSVQ